MNETATITPSLVSEKPVLADDNDTVKFPPLPEPTKDDFDDDIKEEEQNFYKNKFPDVSAVKHERLHCTACDRHLGCSARNESRMRSHPMLRTLVCHTCHSFYNSGEFDKGDDGSELYCRWCGQGGQVYCCSDCPIVFCAKCIKRNFGMPKIKEIENTDDWKCFKCKPECLWDLRAVCWALLRFCDLRNKITYKTQDTSLRDAYLKLCGVDDSECCKTRNNKRKERDLKRKVDNDSFKRQAAVNAVNKLPPAIQVKKFASIPADESPKEKKKRPLSPKTPILVPKPPTLAPKHMFIANKMSPISIGPFPKKIRLPSGPQAHPVRFQQPSNTYIPRYRPRQTPHPLNMLNPFGSFNNHILPAPVNDNINLSLESLTQGLDMAAIAGLAGAATQNNNDVVCTPDFPLEPLCEVTEDANDDDVECMTPAAALAPAAPVSVTKPPPLVPRTTAKDLNTDNIIQMTADDVTVNETTGGLKFRVDPQTLSSNKMYRLPDGRVFAIHSNPSMPGGYSATIVAVTDSGVKQPRGSTFAAKLSAVPVAPAPASPPSRVSRLLSQARRRKVKPKPPANTSTPSLAKVDLKVPVEWYRYNLIDAVDALEYSLSRLHKLKNQATTIFLRSRTGEEMSQLHKTLDHLLKTSSTRFCEIRENLSSEVKQYAARKRQSSSNNVSDDDDVEILNDLEDPIFIDENSMDSNTANETNVTNEVDLTGPASSVLNDNGDKSAELHKDPFNESRNDVTGDVIEEFIPNDVSTNIIDESTFKDLTDGNTPKYSAKVEPDETSAQKSDGNDDDEMQETKEQNAASEEHEAKDKDAEATEINGKLDFEDNRDEANDKKETEIKKESDKSTEVNEDITKNTDAGDLDGSNDNMDVSLKTEVEERNGSNDNVEDDSIEQGKEQDAEMSEDLIETLLNDENEGKTTNMEIPEDFQEP